MVLSKALNRPVRRRLLWWVVFLLSAAPAFLLLGLYFFDPRSLGIDATEVLLQETGEWSLRFLLVTLACSPLKRLGFKGAMRFRRMLGLFAFFYASIHLGTYLIGWIELDLTIFTEDLLRRPFIYLGVLTWIILTMLAVTSPKWAVKRLKKRWTTLHKAIYVAILLAWVHLWMQSRASALEPLVYLAFVLLLLGERVARKSLSHRRS